MKPKSVVIGMVGARFAASFHLENYRRVHGIDVRIKGVTSKESESASKFAREHELEKVYPSVEELLADPEINLVDLCVPNYLHHPLTVQAASVGKNVICEKPLTGYFGGDGDTLVGKETPRKEMFETALVSADEMVAAVETRAGWQLTNPDEDWMNGFPHELQDFCEAVAYDRPPKSTIGLARDIVAVCYGAYVAAETGRRFDLSPWM